MTASNDVIVRDLVVALQAIEPLLVQAIKAYQFGPSSYTYEAMMVCGRAGDLARAAIDKATTEIESRRHDEMSSAFLEGTRPAAG